MTRDLSNQSTPLRNLIARFLSVYVIRGKFQKGLFVGNRLPIVVFGRVSHAAIEIRISAFWVKSDRFIKIGRRGVRTTPILIGDPPIIVGIGVLWDRTTAQLRKELDIRPRNNPRDHFGKYALIYTRLVEEVSTDRLKDLEAVPMSVAMEIVWRTATLFKGQAKELSEDMGYDLVTEKPLLASGKRRKS